MTPRTQRYPTSTRARFAAGALFAAMLLSFAGISPARADGYVAEYLAPFAVPAAMNEWGSVAGWNPVYRTAFVYDDLLGYVELPCFRGYLCRAVDLNDKGYVVGFAQSGEFELRTFAVAWEPAGAGYRLLPLPEALITARTSSQAVAIDDRNRVVGISRTAGSQYARESYFLWKLGSGVKTLLLPGPPVDLNDSGQIAGNARSPYRYDIATGRVIFTEISPEWSGARVHAISADGRLAGAVVDQAGWQQGAVTDRSERWNAVGGGGPGDHLFAINEHGDLAGHLHGLAPGSHCGVYFAEDGELAPLESYFFEETLAWKLGEVAGLTGRRWLAAEAIHGTSGLPALVRLTAAAETERCGGECLSVGVLSVSARGTRDGAFAEGFLATIELAAERDLPEATKVELTWVLDGGAIVKRTSGEAGPDGRIEFELGATAARAEVYVTDLQADGFRFDPTSGILHAESMVWDE